MRAVGWIGLGVLAAAVAGVALSRSDLHWAQILPWRDDVLAWVDRLPWQGPPVQAEQTQPVEASVPRRRAVAALGRIEPHTEVIDLGASNPGLVDQLLVEEGQSVGKGEILGYLDSYKERVAERDQHAARLDEARALLDAEIGLGEAQIAAAEVHLRQVKETYPLRIQAQQARIELLSAELANNQDILDDRLTLQQRAVSSKRTVDDQRTVVRMNEQELEMARAELAQLQAEQQTEILAASTALQREKAALERARAAIGLASIEKDLALADARRRAYRPPGAHGRSDPQDRDLAGRADLRGADPADGRCAHDARGRRGL